MASFTPTLPSFSTPHRMDFNQKLLEAEARASAAEARAQQARTLEGLVKELTIALQTLQAERNAAEEQQRGEVSELQTQVLRLTGVQQALEQALESHKLTAEAMQAQLTAKLQSAEMRLRAEQESSANRSFSQQAPPSQPRMTSDSSQTSQQLSEHAQIANDVGRMLSQLQAAVDSNSTLTPPVVDMPQLRAFTSTIVNACMKRFETLLQDAVKHDEQSMDLHQQVSDSHKHVADLQHQVHDLQKVVGMLNTDRDGLLARIHLIEKDRDSYKGQLEVSRQSVNQEVHARAETVHNVTHDFLAREAMLKSRITQLEDQLAESVHKQQLQMQQFAQFQQQQQQEKVVDAATANAHYKQTYSDIHELEEMLDRVHSFPAVPVGQPPNSSSASNTAAASSASAATATSNHVLQQPALTQPAVAVTAVAPARPIVSFAGHYPAAPATITATTATSAVVPSSSGQVQPSAVSDNVAAPPVEQHPQLSPRALIERMRERQANQQTGSARPAVAAAAAMSQLDDALLRKLDSTDTSDMTLEQLMWHLRDVPTTQPKPSVVTAAPVPVISAASQRKLSPSRISASASASASISSTSYTQLSRSPLQRRTKSTTKSPGTGQRRRPASAQHQRTPVGTQQQQSSATTGRRGPSSSTAAKRAKTPTTAPRSTTIVSVSAKRYPSPAAAVARVSPPRATNVSYTSMGSKHSAQSAQEIVARAQQDALNAAPRTVTVLLSTQQQQQPHGGAHPLPQSAAAAATDSSVPSVGYQTQPSKQLQQLFQKHQAAAQHSAYVNSKFSSELEALSTMVARRKENLLSLRDELRAMREPDAEVERQHSSTSKTISII
eukprot:TRINITY_DN3528_c0_g1_i1.p1 TRINITY_DN3528_c0_g1~~TRINITY_DN3528_c0_g1_i1.p1  ORF type:complete len:836 (-),score=233.34 TRINITY_DN3528_c0_g1_i1:628-3135(-)